MKPISLRVQLGLVGAGYVSVVAIAGALIFARYMVYVNHPQDAAAAGGMYAAGDTFLALGIVCLLMVPTFFLALVARQSENLSILYSRSMLGLSLTAPLSAGPLAIPAIGQSSGALGVLGMICLERLFCAPIFIVAFVCSRLLARFPRAKRLSLYALAIEFLTLTFNVVWFVLLPGLHRS